MEVPQNMVGLFHGRSLCDGCFGGTTVSGNLHILMVDTARKNAKLRDGESYCFTNIIRENSEETMVSTPHCSAVDFP